MTTKHVSIRVGNVTGQLTTVAECDELARQALAARQIIQAALIIRAPKMLDGYISRDEFYEFMHQFTPKENIRRGTGSKIFGTLLRAVLFGRVSIDIKCSKCHGHAAEICKQTKRRHFDTNNTDLYSISVPSLKVQLDWVRNLEGITSERYDMLMELVKFA